ncbi:MAG TPA: MFS transporter [Burkholderiales bacterium]|nr:MFS transporter [Burkholderiales bacterium]
MRPHERRALGWSLLYVFAVLSAYYVLRPIRDEMGVHGGVENLPWLFTGTLLGMLAINPLFAALVRRMPRERFIAWSYRFFAGNLALFLIVFHLADPAQDVWLGRAFFIWLSVFNLFVVSVFWALMVDVFDAEQGKRLFGFLAAGATVGAIAGSTLTASLVHQVAPTNLFIASILLLEVAVFAARKLSFRNQTGAQNPIGGGVLAGISHTLRSPYLLGVCLFIVLFTVTSTFLYFQQATIARDYFADRGSRTAFFAQVDLLVNVLTLAVQLFFTAHILRKLGVALTLGILPLFTLLGFAALAAAPVIAVVVAFQVLRRAANFALARPTRELLFTVLSREDKYKAKSFIDTVVYRAGDQVGSWSYLLLSSFGLGIAGVAVAAVPLSAAWLAISLWLGRRQAKMAPAEQF